VLEHRPPAEELLGARLDVPSTTDGSADHPANGLSHVVHQKHRLGNLSRHLTVVVDAGLLDMEKGYDGRRPKTWVSITRAGRRALADEIAALRALGDRLGS
jgi:hypothetical protein